MKRIKFPILLYFVFLLCFSFAYAQTINWVSGYPKPIAGGNIELRWNAISGATSYTIYRVEGDLNPYPFYPYVSTINLTYTDTNTKDGVLYSYVIATTVGGTVYTSLIGVAKSDRTKPSIDNISATPNPFSPDGDGFRDKVTISFYLSEYSKVTVTLKDSNNNTYTLPDWNNRLCASPGIYNVEWDGYFGNSLSAEGIVTFTIKATDYAGNTNTTDGKLLLDIPDITVKNLVGIPNPFSSSLSPDTIYKASYSYFPIDLNNNVFNLSPTFYLDQSGKLISGIALAFDMVPSGSVLPILKVTILDSAGNKVRGFDLSNFSSPAIIYWYGEKDPEFFKDDPNNPNSWWYKILGNPIGSYKVILEPFYSVTDPISGSVLSVPIKPLITNINLGEIVTIEEDNTPPKVLSISPSSGSLVNDIKYVSAVIDDGNGVGPDLNVSMIRVKDTIGRYVGGIQSNNNVDTIYWTFTSTLTSGLYTIEVVPIDKKGNVGSLVTSTFIIDNSAPQIVNVYPQGGITQVSEIRVEYRDLGSGLNFWDNFPYPPAGSYIEVFTPIGASQKLKFNVSKSSTIYAIADLPFDLVSVDGVYNLGIYLVDKAGNSTFTTSSFLLDKTPPYVVSISLPSYTVNYTISQVQVTLKDNGVGIDLSVSKSFVKLLDSVGNTIAGPEFASTFTLQVLNSNTVTYTLKIPSTYTWLEGEYYLVIKTSDLLGNTFYNISKYILDLKGPSILSVAPTGAVSKIERIEVKYLENLTGIDFIKSRVNINTPSGNISLKFDSQLSDGSTLVAKFEEGGTLIDGVYNMLISLYDNAGNVSSTSTSFVLDTRPPYITSSLPNKGSTIVIAPSYVNVVLKDDTSGIDSSLNKTYLKLLNPNNIEIGTYTCSISSDNKTATLTINTSSVTWTKGVYTVVVKASDLVGNSLSDTYTFSLTLESAQPTGDIVISQPVFSPKKGDLRIDFQFQATSGNITEVIIEIYSMNGKLVRNIYNRTFNTPQAMDTVTWDGKDNLGRLLPNGYYLIKVTIKESTGATKVRFKGFVLVK